MKKTEGRKSRATIPFSTRGRRTSALTHKTMLIGMVREDLPGSQGSAAPAVSTWGRGQTVTGGKMMLSE
jgi:hypothetical protein